MSCGVLKVAKYVDFRVSRCTEALPMRSQRTAKLRQVHPAPTFASLGSETSIRRERQPDLQRVRFIRAGNFPLRRKLRGRTARMPTEA
jgi:hypothetical protein